MIYNTSCFRRKILLIFILIVLVLSIPLLIYKRKLRKKVGIISLRHEVNIGNNLIKYAISIIIKQLGYTPYIIGTHWRNFNISFLNKTTNLVIIKNNFSEIKRNDYDVLMVNSDQTWRRFDKDFYDYGFLKFAESWKIKKFAYGASLGYDYWKLTQKDEEVAKKLIANFSDISVREEGAVKLIEEHFGRTPTFVLDPTLLIDKEYYLNIIKDYKGSRIMNKKYIFVYTISNPIEVFEAVKNASLILNYETYYLRLNNHTTIENFLYYLLNKPFITIYNKLNARARYLSLGNLFGISDRLFENKEKPDFNQLIKPLKINLTLLKQLRLKSINFIKKNLENI